MKSIPSFDFHRRRAMPTPIHYSNMLYPGFCIRGVTKSLSTVALFVDCFRKFRIVYQARYQKAGLMNRPMGGDCGTMCELRKNPIHQRWQSSLRPSRPATP